MKYSYCTLFQAEVIWVQRKWYLGLDFHSRLQLLKRKKGGGTGKLPSSGEAIYFFSRRLGAAA